jgi:hypothetical protein
MNNIEKLIRQRETDGFRFKPGREFYKKIGIRQKRFWMLVRNETEPTVAELKAIAGFFNVNFYELIEK